MNRLWTLTVATGREHLLVDPGTPSGETLPEAERARRERTRERASGIVAYATDAAVTQGRLRARRRAPHR
ncbi:hypothetical protein ACFOY2_00145 [Nonomuraea purpurea]|uniref:MBL fold metallo-hydrolase n=1 Tax=Nonomuraea purpurea TaxID=1849276 RepID=A0ABV8FV73_9ACTN